MIKKLLSVKYRHKNLLEKLKIILIFILILNVNFNFQYKTLCRNFENNDFVFLFKGVNKLTFTGIPGVIKTDNPAVPLVVSSEYTNPKYLISIAGAKYGNGFIISFCHDSFFNDTNFDYFDNKIFTKNILDYSLKKKISISISHGEWFNKSNSTKFINFAKINGFNVEFIETSIYDYNLIDTGIFISGSAWIDFKDFEINGILKFVENGGIAIILALGWSWLTYHSDKKLEELPANVLCSRFNIKWVDGYIYEKNENIYKDATIFKIFYPDTLNYILNINDSLKFIEETLKNNKDLNKYLSMQTKTRQTFIDSLENLYSNIDFVSNKTEIFNRLKELIEQYQYYFKKDHSFNQKEENILCWIREKFSILLYGYGQSLNSEKKEIIAKTLNLEGLYLEIWNKYEVLILDNNKLYLKNLEYINYLLDSMPKEVHNLKLIMIGKLLGEPIDNLYLLDKDEKRLIYDLGASFATKTKIGYAIDLWDLPIDSSYGNPFPNDVPERIDPFFSDACDHELTHIIDMNLILSNDNLKKERENLIKRAGNNRLNYLRSMFEDGFFVKNPIEFIASIGNQWFCDTWNTFDLAIKRFNNGYKEPINQFLFFAKVLSMNKKSVPFYYRINNGTKLIKIDIDIEKDINGRIIKIFDKKNLLNYDFILDNEGYVKGIKKSKISQDSYDLLIITSKKIKESNILEYYKSFKINQGYKIYEIEVENIEKSYSGLDLPEKIRNYLKDFYQKYNIKYLLLIGEPYNFKFQTSNSTGGTIPMRYCYPDPKNHNRIEDTDKDGAVPTDYYYADLTGDWDSDRDGNFGEYNEDKVDFENELIVGRIPFDDVSVIEEILSRSIKFEKEELNKENKKILMAGDIYTYGENNCDRVDSALFFENVWDDFLKDRNFERKTLYEKDGLKPSSFASDLPLNRDNLIKILSENNFDIVSIFTFGGFIDCIKRRIWSKDDGDNIAESNEFQWIDLLDKEDEDLIFPLFSKSIYLIQSFWPSTIDYKVFKSISKLIFLRSAVAVIGNIRNCWFTCGWKKFEDGGSFSIYYIILNNISNAKTIGESLYNSLNYYSKNFLFSSWGYSTWDNLFSHASLFGDPTLSIAPIAKISPPSKIESISISLTKENYVLINWSPSLQGTYKIKGYAIFKGENLNNFSLITTLDSETLSYIDKDIEEGKTYYYYIQS
ncbi:MAG: C25 family cysteine peptidase, partial [Minisyncoccia bacterium]